MFNTSSIFDFSQGLQTGTSPSFPSINIGNFPPTTSAFATSLPQDTQPSSFGQETHHSFDILGLSHGLFDGEKNDQEMAPASTAQQTQFFSHDDGFTASQDIFASMGLPSPPSCTTANNAGSTYTNLSDFLMDPFWQNLQAQQDAAHAARLAGAESEMSAAGMPDLNNASMDFSDPQGIAFFGL